MSWIIILLLVYVIYQTASGNNLEQRIAYVETALGWGTSTATPTMSASPTQTIG